MNPESREGSRKGVPVYFADGTLMKALGYIPIDCSWWPMKEESELMDPDIQPKIIEGAVKTLERYTFLRSIDALCAELDSSGLYVLKPYERRSLTSPFTQNIFEKYC
jgi:hypothetical protein